MYQTDAQAEKRVRVVGAFPEGSYPPITYPVALTVRARPEAARLADFLTGERAADFHPLRVCSAARAPGRG